MLETESQEAKYEENGIDLDHPNKSDWEWMESYQASIFYRLRLTEGPCLMSVHISALSRPGPALNNAQSAAIMRDVQRYAGIDAAIQCYPLIKQ